MARIRRRLVLLLSVASIGAAAVPVSAQDGIFSNMQKRLDFRFSTVSTTTTFGNGVVTRTETRNLFPTLALNTDALIFPSLRLNAGGLFEINAFKTNVDGASTDSTISRTRPFVLLRSTNPVFSPGVGYFRREERAGIEGLAGTKLVNDEYAAYLGWNPAGGPRSDFQYLRTHTFDGAATVQDVRKDFGTAVSSYTLQNFGAYYFGSYLTTDDRLKGLETRQVSHAARVSESGSFLKKRLVWNGLYNVNYQNLRSRATGTNGEVDVPIAPFAGLAGVSDLPVTARLTPNPALIDGNLTASAGIDIGLTAPPDNTQARNIGLDFLNRPEVNRLLIWIDRQVPPEIANTFSWEIYSSTDNVSWQREAQVPAAPFDPFENRFELLFPAVTARYLKVVVRPLSVAVPDSVRFPDIFVSEVQAFDRRQTGAVSTRLSQTTHIVNTDARMRLLDTPALNYEGFFLYDGPGGFGPSTLTFSNGLSLNQAFGRIFSVYGRAAREEGREPRGDRSATLTNATFTVEPISTLRSSVLYTGQDERIAGLPATRHGVFLQNSAQLYRGVNVLFGIGWNRTNRETGENSRDRLMNATATVTPRSHLSFTFSYDDTAIDRFGVVVGVPRTNMRRLYGAVAFDPIATLHLVLGEEAVVLTGQPTRTTHDIGVNWAPFPDGALQLIFAYNEALRPVQFGTDRSTMGAIRWNLSRRSYLDVSYQKIRTEFVFQKTDSGLFGINVRLFV